jgi:large repetitive protein
VARRVVGRSSLLKRLLPLLALAFVGAAFFVSEASAGGIRDWEPCPDGGAGDLICPDGEVGKPYSIKFRAVEEPPCQPGEESWHVINDSLPPGLSLDAGSGQVSGTPTDHGTWGFWIEMRLPTNDHCNGAVDTTQERFVITIKPGIPVAPKLTIGEPAVPRATVGTAFSLAMTANLPDAKTWSIVDGVLPTGLAIDPTTGVIAGTPSATGTFPVTVRAAIADGRADTKALTIVVRSALVLESPDEDPLSEVGVLFELSLTASGGSETYTPFALSSGSLPPGLRLTNGVISGRPTLAGTYTFTVLVTDSEGRTADYVGNLTIAPRLTIPKQRLKTGTVGRFIRIKLKSAGGAGELLWRVKRGPLPKGILFDRITGSFYGQPAKPGTWRVQVEIRDELRVKSTATVTLVVKPAKKRLKK